MKKVDYRQLVPSGTENIEVDMTRTIKLGTLFGDAYFRGTDCMSQRAEGEFKGRAIYLPSNYDWVLGYDSSGEICLIPLTKAEEER